MSCVDWQATLRRASFRGVAFWIERDELEVGRRLVVHQFPNRDRPFVEDLGERAIEYDVTAYVASDSVIAEKNSLISACRQRGPGTLVLPTEGSQSVRCKEARRTHEKDKLGYIAFSMKFVEAGLGLASSSIALLERMVGLDAEAAVNDIAGAFLSVYSLIRAADYASAEALDAVYGWAEAVDLARREIRMDPVDEDELTRAIDKYHADAPTIVVDGRDTVRLRRTQIGLATRDAPSGDLVKRAFELTEALRIGATNEPEAFEALAALAEWDVGGDDVAYSRTGQQAVANRRAIGSAFRRVALLSFATLAAQADWTDRRQGVSARARVAELFDAELGNGEAGTQAYKALSAVRNRTAEALSEKINLLDPVVTVESNEIMPSLVWAYRLYADAGQALDLVARNRVSHPSFMPAEFSALAPPGSMETVGARRRRIGA